VQTWLNSYRCRSGGWISSIPSTLPHPGSISHPSNSCTPGDRQAEFGDEVGECVHGEPRVRGAANPQAGVGARGIMTQTSRCGEGRFPLDFPDHRAIIYRAMQLYRLAWVLWIVGAVLIVLSWISAVTPLVGWVGFAISMTGVLLSWVANQGKQSFRDWRPELQPVPPSGLEIDHDTPLVVGSPVLAFTQGYWWRARIVAIEDDEMVRVDFPGWDPSVQMRVPRTQLQLDLTRSAPTDTSIREGMPPQ
jgi:hypothetical protein